jgi:hypothetical protein
MKFSAKSKLDQCDGVSASGDYSLTHTVNSENKYMIMHKPSNITLDGNFGLWRNKNVWVSLYVNSVLTQNSEKSSLNNKLHVRFHHEDDKIFSVGIEKYDPLNNCSPDVISSWGIWGCEKNGWKPFVGANVAWSVSGKKLNYHKYLLGLKQKDWTTYVQAHLEGCSKKTFSVITDGKINKDLKVSGDWKLNHSKDNEGKVCQKIDATIAGEYRLDASTFVKAKVSTDRTMSVSLNRNFRQLMTLGFTTKFRLSPGFETKKCSVGYKFGLLVELNDTA